MPLVQRSAGNVGFGVGTVADSLAGTTANNLIILVSSWLEGSALFTPPTVSGTITWNTAISPAGVVCANNAAYEMGTQIFWGISAGGTIAPTLTLTSSNAAAKIRMSEFSGYLTSGVLDQTATNFSPGGTPVTAGNSGTTAALAQNNELVVVVIGAMEINGSSALAFTDPASSGYTSLDLNNTSASSQSIEASWKEVTTGGTQIGSWTWATAGEYRATIATFKATGGGGGAVQQKLPLTGVGAIAPLAWIIRRRQIRARERNMDLRSWKRDESSGLIVPEYKKVA